MAEVGTWVDEDGRTHYGAVDHPKAIAYAKKLAAEAAEEEAKVPGPVVEPSVPDIAPAPDDGGVEGLEE